MARHTFFSFHYQRDIWRVNQIRNSWVIQGNTTAGFWDDADWESVKRKGDQAITSWIDRQMIGTSVTVVLIGSETCERKYVLYEILKSYREGKGILGIRIHNMKDQYGKIDRMGYNPLDILQGDNGPLSESYETYDWVLNNGYKNLGNWIEQAAVNRETNLRQKSDLNYF